MGNRGSEKSSGNGIYQFEDGRGVAFFSFYQYNPRTHEGGLFAAYIDGFMTVKQESSRYPSHVLTVSDKESYITRYLNHEGIALDPTKIEKNPGLHAILKGIINVLWGKFAERSNLQKTTFIRTSAELLDMLKDEYLSHSTLGILSMGADRWVFTFLPGKIGRKNPVLRLYQSVPIH